MGASLVATFATLAGFACATFAFAAAAPAAPVTRALSPAATAPAETTAIEVVTLQPQPAIVRTLRAKPAELADAMLKTVLALLGIAQQQGLDVAGPPFAIHILNGAELVVDAGLPVRTAATTSLTKGCRAITLPGGRAALLVVHGPHDQLPVAHARLDRWLAAQHETAAGARWEIYRTNPLTTPKPADQETAIVVPLTPRAR
jgi:hypothetical protein